LTTTPSQWKGNYTLISTCIILSSIFAARRVCMTSHKRHVGLSNLPLTSKLSQMQKTRKYILIRRAFATERMHFALRLRRRYQITRISKYLEFLIAASFATTAFFACGLPVIFLLRYNLQLILSHHNIDIPLHVTPYNSNNNNNDSTYSVPKSTEWVACNLNTFFFFVFNLI